jgi:hypothetical protein
MSHGKIKLKKKRKKSYSTPLNKTLGWGPVAPLLPMPLQSLNLFSRAFQQLKSIGSGLMQSTRKCLKSNKVFTAQCLA